MSKTRQNNNLKRQTVRGRAACARARIVARFCAQRCSMCAAAHGLTATTERDVLDRFLRISFIRGPIDPIQEATKILRNYLRLHRSNSKIGVTDKNEILERYQPVPVPDRRRMAKTRPERANALQNPW